MTKRVLILLALCASCEISDPFVGDVYAVQSIEGQVLPAPYALNPDVSFLAYADTFYFRPDGTGEDRFVHTGETPGSRTADVNTFTWSQTGTQMSITFDCAPNALCIAGPHLVGTVTSSDLTITQSAVSRHPIVMRRLLPAE